jgi:hypothetical protein
MDPAAAFDVHFSTYTTGALADDSYIFFTIFDLTDSVVAFSDGFLPPTTTELTIPASTLDPNHDFNYELIYSNRVSVPNSEATFDALLSFDLRTSGTFSTVPESASAFYITLLAVILGRMAWRLRTRPTTGSDVR